MSIIPLFVLLIIIKVFYCSAVDHPLGAEKIRVRVVDIFIHGV